MMSACVCVCERERENSKIYHMYMCTTHMYTHTCTRQSMKNFARGKLRRLGKMSRISSQGGHHAHTCTPLILIRTASGLVYIIRENKYEI